MVHVPMALLFVAEVCLQPTLSQDDVFPPEDDGSELPSEDTCYYNAMLEGCPGSLGHDAKQAVCNCNYDDNTWFHVLANFLRAFRTGPAERSQLMHMFKVRMEADGILSMDVGYTERLQCGAAVVEGYPGTDMSVNAMQLYRLSSNFIYPTVQNSLNSLCVPGRMALQLFCLHAELFRKNIEVAKAYATQIGKVLPLADGCLQELTPWPFPGLAAFITLWRNAKLPEDAIDPGRLAWWPEPTSMRAKLPHEAVNNFWPCVEMADPSCFPAGSDNAFTSCASCCDPGKGPTGNSECFVGEWTFARCCRTPGGAGRFY